MPTSDFQSILKKIKNHVETGKLAPDFCEFSIGGKHEDDPHPPYDNDALSCDGYGNIFIKGTDQVRPHECGCYRRWRLRKMIDNYEKQIGPAIEFVNLMGTAERSIYAMKYVSGWEGYPRPALLMSGPTGCGKTMAGHFLMLELIVKYQYPGFYFSAQTLGELYKKAAMFDDDQKAEAHAKILRIMDAAERKPTLFFLDDLGRERQTDATKEDLSNIIRTLYNRKAHAIITTNLTSREIADRYGEDVADRILDRDWMLTQKVDVKSGRKKK